jgi:hypothetical protein
LAASDYWREHFRSDRSHPDCGLCLEKVSDDESTATGNR